MSSASVEGFPRRFPPRDDFRKPWRYRLICGGLHLVFAGLFARGKLRIEGMENVPRDGPLIIAANHLSDVDPLLLGAYLPGTLFAMGKREIFALFPGAPWLLSGCNAFPVDRAGADRWAFKTALDVLKRRGRLIVFIEGTRSPSPGMSRAQKGVGSMLRCTDAAVLPCAVWGSENVLGRHMKRPRRAPVTLRFGMPLEGLGVRTDDAQLIADRCGAEIAALLPPEYRGYYAAAVDEPRVAAR